MEIDELVFSFTNEGYSVNEILFITIFLYFTLI